MAATALAGPAAAQTADPDKPAPAAAATPAPATTAPTLQLPELRDLNLAVPRPVRAASAMLGMGRQRLALVLGLATVGSRAVVDNAPRDVQAVAAVLRESGFVVMLREDLLAADLRATLKEFNTRLQPGGIGFVYAAGLGTQLDGQNVLLPRDVPLDASLPAAARQALWRGKAVPLAEVVDALMGPAGSPRLLVVDAAYQHPALADLPARGLVEQRLPPGMIALFSHAPGTLQEVPAVAALPSPAPADAKEVAASRFARTLVAQLGAPRAKGPDALRATRRALVDGSLGQVEPWLGGDTDSEEVAEASLVDGLVPRTPEDMAREAARQVARTMTRPAVTAATTASTATTTVATTTLPATPGVVTATATATGEQSVTEVLDAADKPKPSLKRPAAGETASPAGNAPADTLRPNSLQPTPANAASASAGSAASTASTAAASSGVGTALSTAAGAVGTAASVAGTVATAAVVAKAVEAAAAVSVASTTLSTAGSLASNAMALATRGAAAGEPPAAVVNATATASTAKTTAAAGTALATSAVAAAGTAALGGDLPVEAINAAAPMRPPAPPRPAETPAARPPAASVPAAVAPRVNAFGYGEGDSFTYRTIDTWKGQVQGTSTTAIEQVLDDGSLLGNGQQMQLDPQGRVLRQTNADGTVSQFEPRQELWWSNPQRGESRDLRFKETLQRGEGRDAGQRGEVEWKGSASVGRPVKVQTPAGEFEVLPIESSGWQYARRSDGTRADSKWSRTVWYSPRLGHPVAIDIEDTDHLGRLLRRERVELLRAQSARQSQ